MWRGGHWRGARDHLEVRRGTKATWQSPGGPRVAQVALTRGRGHAAAREGRHVACEGFPSGGPTGIVGPGNSGGMVTLWLCRGAPLFNRQMSLYFLRVGLCSHTILPFRRRGRVASVGSPHGRVRSRGPESSRSSNPSRAKNGDLSNDDPMTYHAPRGNPRSSRSSSNRRPWDDRDHPICIGRPRLFAITVTHVEQSWSADLHQTDAMGAPCRSRSNLPLTATMKRNPSLFLMIPGASDFNPTAQTGRGRTPRSRSDRTAIAARSSRDQRVYVVESPPFDRTAIDERRGPRSWPDRG